jgi:FkbM family methyltransferase
LEQGLESVQNVHGDGPLAIYMYTGSLEHARVVYDVISKKNNVRANINLFYAYNKDENNEYFSDIWRPFLEEIKESKKIKISLPTKKLQEDFQNAFGIKIPIAPHPSTTFSDEQARALLRLQTPALHGQPCVLFPGGMRPEKGYPLSIKAADELVAQNIARSKLRALVTDSTPAPMVELIKSLRETSVTLDSRDLNDSEFKTFLESGDIIVCPYLPEAFARRTSGLVIDAMLLGRPVVVVKGTWLADLTVSHGIGVAVDPAPSAIVDGVQQIIADYPTFISALWRARRSYFIEHSWRRLVDTIVDPDWEKASSVNSQTTLPLSREQHIVLDETDIIADMLRHRRGSESIIVDVGAHRGASASSFVELGWNVYCFEPDPENREVLASKFANNPNVKIDPRAVSDRPAADVQFYKSPESTGVSSLHPFLATHREEGMTDVTTIKEVVRSWGISRIDFLKIDVEGADLAVLKGVPWDRLTPDVIECEFEDHKTVPIGHTSKDIAQFLSDKGYAVYVSEWHPIIQYGKPHDWRRLMRFHITIELDPDAWGNMLAFREDPGFDAVVAAFENDIRRKHSDFKLVPASDPSPALGYHDVPDKTIATPLPNHNDMAEEQRVVPAQSVGDQPEHLPDTKTATSLPNYSDMSEKYAAMQVQRPSDQPSHRPFYADFGEWLMWRSPRLFRVLQRGRRAAVRSAASLKAKAPPLFRLGQFAGWLFAAAWRHKLAALVLVLVCALFIGSPFYDAGAWLWRFGLWAAAAVLLAAAAAGVVLRQAVRRIAIANEAAVAKAIRNVRQSSERRSGELERRLGARAAEAADAREEALRADLKALRQGIDQRLHAEIEERVVKLGATVGDELAEVRKNSEAQGKRLAGFETALSTAQARAVSLDVVSALRAMRPFWLGGSAVEQLKGQPEVEHGHALLMAVLADEAAGRPDCLAGKTIIEIGSTRERDAAQGSTEKLAIFTTMTGMRFVTVDMDPLNTKHAERVLRYLNPAAQAVTAKGEDYLAIHAGPLDIVYLDAFDFCHDNHSKERKERYDTILHTDINDEECWRMHLSCAETIVARMPEGGIVALDDTWTDSSGNYAGKGKLAMPFLLDHGFEIIARTRRTVALRRTAKGGAGKKAKAATAGKRKRGA